MKKINRDYEITDKDKAYMKIALDLSRRGLGNVSPNPSVGCVIVKDDHIIGRGWTGTGGRPHAETIALTNAVISTIGATAYVTLEPCAHQGQTPPCAQSLVNAQITKIFIATGDPDNRVSGKGINILKKAGIDVHVGLLKKEADFINQGFFQKININRPLVTIKIASSTDGKIAKRLGEQTWVTGPEARRRGHLFRASHDAIMIGCETALVDDPTLDCRIEGIEDHSPIRVVLDSRLRISSESNLCNSAQDIPLWVMTCSDDKGKKAELENKGVKVFCLSKDDQSRVDIDQVMITLSNQGITRILSEGGGQLNASLVKANLVDRLIWFKSSENVGEKGVNALYDISLNQLDQYLNLSLIAEGTVGEDLWQEYEIKS